jgi:ribonuclease D
MFLSNISKEEINRLDLVHYQGKIQLIEDEKHFESVFDIIHQHSFVGFDTETKPCFQKGGKNRVSLVQIAVPEHVFLLRIHKTGLKNELLSFLENDQILKVGVAIRNDAKELQQISPFKAAGFLELPDVTTKIGIEAKGLRSLAAIILKGRISKAAKITNWEAERLSDKQLTYAATDAWVCMQMYQRLIELELLNI